MVKDDNRDSIVSNSTTTIRSNPERSRPMPSQQPSPQRTVNEEGPAQSSILDEFERIPLHHQIWRHVNGEEGAGYVISLVVHAILLALLSIPIIAQLDSPEYFTTTVREESDETVVVDEPIDTVIPLPVSSSAGGDPLSKLPEVNLDALNTELQDLNLADMNQLEGQDTAGGIDGTSGGKRIAQPKNAIKAGNFSVWPWPIRSNNVKNLRNDRFLAEPGTFPKPRQDYLIVIRIKVPGDRKSVSIRDFSGTVVGTDKYEQIIPDGCYYFTGSGKLMPVRVRPSIPVIDGEAELIVRVPGAAAFVEDTINIHSNILDEDQEIKLIFRPN